MKKTISLIIIMCLLVGMCSITVSAKSSNNVTEAEKEIKASNSLESVSEIAYSSAESEIHNEEKEYKKYINLVSDFDEHYVNTDEMAFHLNLSSFSEYDYTKTHFSTTENILLDNYYPKELVYSDNQTNFTVPFNVKKDVISKTPILDYSNASFENIYITTNAYAENEVVDTKTLKLSVLPTANGVYVSEYGDIFAYDSYISYMYSNDLITAQEYKYAVRKATELKAVDGENMEFNVVEYPTLRVYNEKTDSVELIANDSSFDVWDISGQTNSGISLMATSASGNIVAPTMYISRTIEALDSGERLRVYGYVRWTDIDGNLHPARNIEVKIMDDDVIVDSAVATAYTNTNGYYTATFNNKTGIIEKGLDIYIRVNTGNNDFQIQPDIANSIFSNGYYYVTEVTQNVTTSQPNQYYEGNDSNAIRAMSVHQALVTGYYYYETMNNDDAHSIEVIYPLKAGEGSTSSDSVWNYIYIQNDDYCDWDVILHELGHQVSKKIDVYAEFTESHFATENLSERYGKDLGIKGAWSEGWASYFSIASQIYYNNNIATISNITNVADNCYMNLQLNSQTSTYSDNDIMDYTTYSGFTEGNEAAVTVVLLKLILDSNIGLSHQWVWNMAKQNKCDNFSKFMSALYDNTAKYLHTYIGKHLERQNIADFPKITTILFDRETPGTFEWAPARVKDNWNQSQNPNEDFNKYEYHNHIRVRFYDKNLNIILQTPLISSDTKTATISAEQWSALSSAVNIGDPFYWELATYQNDFPATGPYYSSIHKCFFDEEFINISSLNTGYSSTLTVDGCDLYMFKAPEKGDYVFYSEGTTDVRLTYSTSQLFDNLDVTSDDSGEGYNFLYRASINSNTTVYLKVDGYASASGSYKIVVSKICDLENENQGSLLGEVGIWYQFTAPYAGTYSFISTSDREDTYGELFNYPTTDGSILNRLAWNDDGGDDENFKLTYSLDQGQTVYLRVRGYDDYFNGQYKIVTYYPLSQQNSSNSYYLGYGGYYIYEFTAPDNGNYTFYTEGDTDTYIDVFGAFVYDITSTEGYIGYDDDSGEDFNCSVTCYLTANQTVYVRIKGYDETVTGTFCIIVSEITRLYARDPIECFIAEEQGRWYVFTAPFNGKFDFFTTGSTNTAAILYSVYSPYLFDTPLASNNDYNGNHNFNISYELSEGETVYLYVYGFYPSTTGYYTIFVED